MNEHQLRAYAAELTQQLKESRETNQRLNKRCQALESEIAAVNREHRHLARSLQWNLQRAHSYANELRDRAFAHRREDSKRMFAERGIIIK
jgi:chromosome segregation ATPase